ncbi:astra associated protein 1 A [Schizosaccharomyces japonicus yFS275]|uniref:ASTRA-associated protein 1 n=1 Tax=Schizosaccharomyces japonicus (strain yFS275 / FY16936) TaxID=402676 RepID=ASA1_SCHJY|nr:astra associated protein 1 A [Schizosaccharomyces japonicus yFS275]B6K7R8.1 RecName: Full=ASTRA-associated protein 1 [Schizosaccharomyces japonicus yFS275]EEB09572.1 astra associated protein 1 A [Schizosaccharomyces japonicus yFS275]
MVVPTPFFVLRGHLSSVTSLSFVSDGILYSGDANGWMICWDLSVMRPTHIWRAHTKSILGVYGCSSEVVWTHGRDMQVARWHLNPPTGGSHIPLSLLHAIQQEKKNDQQSSSSLTIVSSVHKGYFFQTNNLTFCSFAISPAAGLLVVPNTVNAEQLDVYALNDTSDSDRRDNCGKRLQHALEPKPQIEKTGAVMSVALHVKYNKVVLVAGYESGHVVQYIADVDAAQKVNVYFQQVWQVMYAEKVHKEPVLSVVFGNDNGYLYSSSADDYIVRHTICLSKETHTNPESMKTGHPGQQCLRVRSDDKILVSAGWDGRGRVYGAKSLAKLAVLKYHSETCNCAAIQPGSNLIALGSKDSRISLWQIY